MGDIVNLLTLCEAMEMVEFQTWTVDDLRQIVALAEISETMWWPYMAIEW